MDDLYETLNGYKPRKRRDQQPLHGAHTCRVPYCPGWVRNGDWYCYKHDEGGKHEIKPK